MFSEILNFKIRQFKRFDGGWGSLDKKTGKWNGMFSNLINGEADLASVPFTICCYRSEAVDFIWTLSHDWLGFSIKSIIFKYILNSFSLSPTAS